MYLCCHCLLCLCCPVQVWEDMDPSFFLTFWTLTMSDLEVPHHMYEKEIKKIDPNVSVHQCPGGLCSGWAGQEVRSRAGEVVLGVTTYWRLSFSVCNLWSIFATLNCFLLCILKGLVIFGYKFRFGSAWTHNFELEGLLLRESRIDVKEKYIICH